MVASAVDLAEASEVAIGDSEVVVASAIAVASAVAAAAAVAIIGAVIATSMHRTAATTHHPTHQTDQEVATGAVIVGTTRAPLVVTVGMVVVGPTMTGLVAAAVEVSGTATLDRQAVIWSPSDLERAADITVAAAETTTGHETVTTHPGNGSTKAVAAMKNHASSDGIKQALKAAKPCWWVSSF